MRHIGPPPTPVTEFPLAARRAARRRPLRPRLDWGALGAGLAVAAATDVALAILGRALGLAPATGQGGGAGVLGTALWGGAVTAVSLYAGGSATGHVAGRRSAGRGTLHGLVLWALATLLAELLAVAGARPAVAAALGAPGAIEVASLTGGTAGPWLALLGLVVGLAAAVAGARGLPRR